MSLQSFRMFLVNHCSCICSQEWPSPRDQEPVSMYISASWCQDRQAEQADPESVLFKDKTVCPAGRHSSATVTWKIEFQFRPTRGRGMSTQYHTYIHIHSHGTQIESIWVLSTSSDPIITS